MPNHAFSIKFRRMKSINSSWHGHTNGQWMPVKPEILDIYEAVNPSWMSSQGILRYWQKI